MLIFYGTFFIADSQDFKEVPYSSKSDNVTCESKQLYLIEQ